MELLLVDDHTLFREGLTYIVKQLDNDVNIVEAASYAQAQEAITQHKGIDLILLDLGLPDCNGFTALYDFRARFPLVPIVVLSASEAPSDVTTALSAGAQGYIPKSSNAKVLLSALRLIFDGGIYVPPVMIGHYAAANRTSGPWVELPERTADIGHESKSKLAEFTDRQREVLGLLIEGKANKVIANHLNISEGTVKIHLATIYRLLNAKTRTQAVIAAGRLGLRTEIAKR